MSVIARRGEYEADVGKKTGLNLAVTKCPLQNVLRKNIGNDS